MKPSAPGTYIASPITGTGSRFTALDRGQHNGSIADNPFFTGLVPAGLLRDCDKKRKDTLVRAVRKATHLYRRVATVNYRTGGGKVNELHVKSRSAKCLVCLVTLVKSSKDRQRAGVKLHCPCNVRVCTTCLNNNPEWHLTMPHFTTCPTLRGFICTVCACFEGVKEKVCCVWMCSRCSSERQNADLACSQCARSLDLGPRRNLYLYLVVRVQPFAWERGTQDRRCL
ncbi:hypothetical protein EYF80_043547 [Liparis tanakae]|uniref:Uncharacterized protein n=1 Tax=Liparis tanakae TaxID=230148 RepID=A0A4Z2FYJ1_9TELE|nr:hypothetical protein EYF80_043547 [Liparis tanakae]